MEMFRLTDQIHRNRQDLLRRRCYAPFRRDVRDRIAREGATHGRVRDDDDDNKDNPFLPP